MSESQQRALQAQHVGVDTVGSAQRDDVLRFEIIGHSDQIHITQDAMILVGRSLPGQPVTLDLSAYDARDKGVSRRHLLIFPTPTGTAVRDLHSTHGTCLNKMPLDPGRAYALENGDELQCGGLFMRVYFGRA